MNNLTLIIPAKNEPNALPLVLKELKKFRYKFKILIVIDKKDKKTYHAAKKFNCKIINQSKKGYGNAIIDGIKHSKTKYSSIFKPSENALTFFTSANLSLSIHGYVEYL